VQSRLHCNLLYQQPRQPWDLVGRSLKRSLLIVAFGGAALRRPGRRAPASGRQLDLSAFGFASRRRSGAVLGSAVVSTLVGVKQSRLQPLLLLQL